MTSSSGIELDERTAGVNTQANGQAAQPAGWYQDPPPRAPAAVGAVPPAPAGAVPQAAPATGSTGGPLLGTGPRIPRLVEWLDIPEYPGFRAKCWINPTRRLAADLQSGDEVRVRGVLKALVLEHNNWCDDEGHPLPQAQEDAFLDELGMHLLKCLMAAIGERSLRDPLAPRKPAV